jgi:hypothetical protein
MVSCAEGYLLPPKGKSEAVQYARVVSFMIFEKSLSSWLITHSKTSFLTMNRRIDRIWKPIEVFLQRMNSAGDPFFWGLKKLKRERRFFSFHMVRGLQAFPNWVLSLCSTSVTYRNIHAKFKSSVYRIVHAQLYNVN